MDIIETLAPQIDDWEQLDLYGTPLVHSLLMQLQVFTSKSWLIINTIKFSMRWLSYY